MLLAAVAVRAKNPGVTSVVSLKTVVGRLNAADSRSVRKDDRASLASIAASVSAALKTYLVQPIPAFGDASDNLR